MNYLAHVFLSPDQHEVMLGNLMGDFIKGNNLSVHSFDIQRGIILHRSIDKFTDNHVVVKRLKMLLSKPRQRYSGIISDIVFDHFLAKHWRDYSNQELSDFSAECYQILANHLKVMPEKMQFMVKRMIERDWLTGYACIENTGHAIDGVSRRIRFNNPLAGAIIEVEQHYDEYQAAFKVFFPELIEFSNDVIFRISQEN